MQTSITVDGDKITGTLKFIEGGLCETGPLAGDGYFLALKWSSLDTHTTSLKVGLDPSSSGMGLIECFDDPDRNGVFKITPELKQYFVIQQSDGTHTTTQYLDLSTLTFEEPEEAVG